MKKIFFLCALMFVSASHAVAQGGVGYRYDNFDTQQGIQIMSAPEKPGLTMSRSGSTPHSATKNKKAASLVKRPQFIHASASHSLNRTAAAAAAASRTLAGKTLAGFTTGNAAVDALIAQSGARNSVDPALLYAVMHQESSFKLRALSHKGACGLMQLMPGTASRFGVRNIFDPAQNIEGGARYMRFLLNTFDDDVALALAGYNAGEGAVLRYGRRVPPYRETQEYVRRITRRYSLMRDPQTTWNAPNVTSTQIAAIQAAEPVIPETVYERSVFAVRLPDGKLRLVCQ